MNHHAPGKSGNFDKLSYDSLIVTRCRLAMVVLATSAFLFTCWLGRFPYTDEAVFKSAGKHWAETGRFIAPELSGFLNVNPPLEDIFFIHLPTYPFLFGLWVKLFGFGWHQCITFDAFFHALLIVITFELATSIARFTQAQLNISVPAFLGIIAPIIIAPLPQPGRPDELAMCLGFVGLRFLLWNVSSLSRVVASGTCFGICAATSPGAALTLGFTAFFLVILLRNPLPSALLHGLIWLVFALGVAGLIIMPVLVGHPDAYKQFLTHAHWVSARPFLKDSLAGWGHYKHRVLPVIGLIIFSVFSLSICLKNGWLKWFGCLWAGPLIATVYLILRMPGEYLYFWFYTPWLIASTIAACSVFFRSPDRVRAILAGTVVGLFLLSAYYREALLCTYLLNLPEKQTIPYNSLLIAKTIPPHSTVLTTYSWWLFPTGYRLLDPIVSRYKNLDEIDYVVLAPIGGGGMGKYQWEIIGSVYKQMIVQRFHPIVNNLPGQPLRLFGISLTHTTWGHGMIIFARTKPRVEKKDYNEP